MPCRLNCTRKICGRVRLHVTTADPAVTALAEAMRAMTGRKP